MRSAPLPTEPNSDETKPRRRAHPPYLTIAFLVVAVVLTFLATHSVARIEDKFLQTHPLFFDPVAYQYHQCELWVEAKHTPRIELALGELSQDIDAPDPCRTIPLILLNPDWLRDSRAHLITSGFGLFIFLCLLMHTVRKRTGSALYALAAGALLCAIPGFYDPILGLGAFWLDLTAGFYGGAAVLCLINSEQGSKMGWLAGFATLAGIACLARFVSGPYLALQCGPILAFYLVTQWRKTGNFFRAVAWPFLLIGAILAVLIGWYLWKETAGIAYYYETTGYGYMDVVRSLQFTVLSTISFVSISFSICLVVIAVTQLWLGRHVRWKGLAEALWLALSVGFFLSITTIIGPARHALQYFVPIAAFALLSPVDLSGSKRDRPIVAVALGFCMLAAALAFFGQDLQSNLWRPPRAQPWDLDRKAFYETVTKKLVKDYPQKTAASYFDEFDEYVYVIGVEEFGRTPNLLSDRVFSVHESYLSSNFPGKGAPELVEMAWRQANDQCDLVLAFNDPKTSQVRSPYDYGGFLNPVSTAIAFEMAKRLQDDTNWRKLFVIPSKYLPGGVAVYANLKRFPEAEPDATK
jgi:MFS family permease